MRVTLDTNIYVSALHFGGKPMNEADATDNQIVECAVASSSETVVSGDRHLLAPGQFRGISVLRVGDALLRNVVTDEG